jgi:hypothetical protein
MNGISYDVGAVSRGALNAFSNTYTVAACVGTLADVERFRENATLYVSPFAIVRDDRRYFRFRRDKMFNARYLANDTTFSRNFFSQAIYEQCVE